MKPLILSTLSSLVILYSFVLITGASTPKTVSINTPVTITDTAAMPSAVNLGNPGNLSAPTFLDYVYADSNYYAFVSNYSSGNLVRLDFGNSLLNTPTSVNLGNYGGLLQANTALEGIQVVQNEGNWYAIIVSGFTDAGTQPRIVKINFGASITNQGFATNWGNMGNMEQPIDFQIFKEGDNWYGFTVNSENNTITRFNFTNSFNNIPTAVNLGNSGALAYPTGIYIINDNGFWRVFITNGGDNRQNGFNSSITRLDFGSSLLNTPTAVNLGNPGGNLHHPRDLTIVESCGHITGFAVNGNPGYYDLVQLNFGNNLSSAPTAASLGNTGNYSFPHSISKLFQVNGDVYAFITNVANNTISRLRFAGCTNAGDSTATGDSTVQNLVQQVDTKKVTIKLSPNPTTGPLRAWVATSEAQKGAARLYDLNGNLKQVLQSSINFVAGVNVLTFQVNRSGLPAGTYFVKIWVGSTVQTFKVLML